MSVKAFKNSLLFALNTSRASFLVSVLNISVKGASSRADVVKSSLVILLSSFKSKSLKASPIFILTPLSS